MLCKAFITASSTSLLLYMFLQEQFQNSWTGVSKFFFVYIQPVAVCIQPILNIYVSQYILKLLLTRQLYVCAFLEMHSQIIINCVSKQTDEFGLYHRARKSSVSSDVRQMVRRAGIGSLSSENKGIEGRRWNCPAGKRALLNKSCSFAWPTTSLG